MLTTSVFTASAEAEFVVWTMPSPLFGKPNGRWVIIVSTPLQVTSDLARRWVVDDHFSEIIAYRPFTEFTPDKRKISPPPTHLIKSPALTIELKARAKIEKNGSRRRAFLTGCKFDSQIEVSPSTRKLGC